MNLISEPWIPVRRADGSRDKIAPCQITDHVGTDKSPIVAIASPRPDLDGALVQFLIGLLQTTCTPPNKGIWHQWRREPPSMEELKSRFETVAFFELEGEQAFMQDLQPEQLTETWPIERLLIGSPGENAIKKGTDHFIKRKTVSFICPHCAAVAIYCLQINGPAFGSGYREGMRSGGPLTTLVLPKEPRTLWETCWLNVLDKVRYLGNSAPEYSADKDRFPWLEKTRTSEAKPPAGITIPIDVHPDQQYWPMPNRIRLISEKTEAMKSCGVCGEVKQAGYTSFRIKNHGILYQHFEHPLSPHRKNDKGIKTVRTDPAGIGYRHWLGLIENSKDGDNERCPAKVVERFRLLGEDGRLWAFGYDIVSGQANARCWYDATMPMLVVPEGLEDIFKALVEQMVRAADWVAGVLRSQIKDALLGDGNARGDLSFVQAHFWSATEGAFYAHVKNLRDVLSQPNGERPVLESWLRTLRNAALTIFDHYAQSGDFDAADPRRIATARNDLSKALNGKKLRDVLGLPHTIRKAA
jgi:CRISPR system Cascade subunit CasA